MDNFFYLEEKYFGSRQTMTVKIAQDIPYGKCIQHGVTDDFDHGWEDTTRHYSLLDGHYCPELTFPVTFRPYHTYKMLREFLCYFGEPLLISSKFKAILEDHQISGWKTFPAILKGYDGKEIPNYHGFTITGRCGPRDRSRTKLIDDKYYGVFLKAEEWDGSDICLENEYWGLIISPKAAAVFKKQKALEAIPLAEVAVESWLYRIHDRNWADLSEQERRVKTYSQHQPR